MNVRFMRFNAIKSSVLLILALLSATLHSRGEQERKPRRAWSPVIPMTWNDAAMASLEIPLAEAPASPVQVSADYYYKIPVRPIYESYPVYAPGHEPAHYLTWLERQEPKIALDVSKLKSKADWIRAGEIVFDAPVAYDLVFKASHARDPRWYEKTGMPSTKDGRVPYFRYVVRQKGKVELGVFSCAMCHTRLMTDGSILKGAQGNLPFDRAVGFAFRAAGAPAVEQMRLLASGLFGAPWLKSDDPRARFEKMSVDEIASLHEAIPPGVLARHRSSPFYPVQVPDLIGVRDRHYLDRTGLQLHRSIVDLVRYAALNQGGDDLARYGSFSPVEWFFGGVFPEPDKLDRYSDEELYALSLYIYSLKPPPNPHRFDRLAARGKKVFQREGCALCHTPPSYGDDKLVPADGFDVPDDHLKKYEILQVPVGTDPNLTLRTRRGTGYYKVPSLRGLWYRGPLEHSGSVATLEDWFDPKRIRDDYVPTGFRGHGVKARAVKGHLFGLDLSAEDRRSLIAFLKTL